MIHMCLPSSSAARVNLGMSPRRVRKTLKSGVPARRTPERLSLESEECDHGLQERGDCVSTGMGVNAPRYSLCVDPKSPLSSFPIPHTGSLPSVSSCLTSWRVTLLAKWSPWMLAWYSVLGSVGVRELLSNSGRPRNPELRGGDFQLGFFQCQLLPGGALNVGV